TPFPYTTLFRSTVLPKFLRQTGARGFVESCAIGDDRPIFGGAGKVVFEVVRGNADGAVYLHVRFRPSLWIACVEEQKRLTNIKALAQLIDRNSLIIGHRDLLFLGFST